MAYADALKRKVRVVLIHHHNNKGDLTQVYIYFSTNVDRLGIEIVLYYRLRFQQAFLFRDAKQWTGLTHCQARIEAKLADHFNASLTGVNLAKIYQLANQTEPVDKAVLFSNTAFLFAQ